jgi:hypothetical protein
MKKQFTLTLLLCSLLLTQCISDCGRTDFGNVLLLVFDSEGEELAGLDIAVYPIKYATFDMNDEVTTLEEASDYYGAEITQTDEAGRVELEVGYTDGATSCDGKRKTYDNSFESVIIFYECAAGALRYQEFTAANGLQFINSTNQIDAVVIESDCL